MSLATWNILAEEYLLKYARKGCYRGVSAAARTGRAGRVAERVQQLAARNDFVFLQEAEEAVVNQLRRDGLRVAYAPRAEGKGNGLAWITGPRVQVIRETVHPFDLTEAGPSAAPLARNWVCLETMIDGRAVRATGTHLAPDAVRLREVPERRGGAAQARLLLGQLAAGAWCADLLAGDLNAAAGDSALEAFGAAGFLPLDPPAGDPGPTAAIERDGTQQWERIDWILARGAAPLTGALVPSAGTELPLPSEAMPSDHLPIEGRLTLPGVG